MPTYYEDDKVFNGDVTFAGNVTWSQTPPEISLDNLTDLTGAGTCTFSDLVATDDVTVGDDFTVAGAAAIGETLDVTGNATIGGTLGVTGATTCAALTASGTLTTSGTLDVNGPLDLAGATVVAPHVVPRWYTSQEITTGDLEAGASLAIALDNLPAGSWHVLAVHVETGAEVASGDAGTTGLSLQLGHTGGDVDALVESISIFGAASIKVAPAGVEVGGYVDLADAVEVLLTAAGGDADLADITGLRLRVGLLLAPAPAISFA